MPRRAENSGASAPLRGLSCGIWAKGAWAQQATPPVQPRAAPRRPLVLPRLVAPTAAARVPPVPAGCDLHQSQLNKLDALIDRAEIQGGRVGWVQRRACGCEHVGVETCM